MTMRRPDGLGPGGSRLWDTVHEGWVLEDREVPLLTAACRTLDECDRLTAALADAPPVVPGHAGQPRVNPLFGEARQHRLALARLLRALNLPVEVADPGEGEPPWSEASVRARRAAQARWRRRHGPDTPTA